MTMALLICRLTSDPKDYPPLTVDHYLFGRKQKLTHDIWVLKGSHLHYLGGGVQLRRV